MCATAEDFPLTAFRGRHGSASQAIGYGKMLMLAHMLRVMLGDDAFRRGLQRFYADNRFRSADFDDLRIAFEQASNQDLQAFFDAWTERTGAPELKLGSIDLEQSPGGGYRVSGSLYQTQVDPAFPLVVPIVIHAERGQPGRILAEFDERHARFDTVVAGPPVRVAVDPGFDSFRRLMPSESPVTLSNLFGAEAGLIVFPARAPEALRAGYLALAQDWQRGHEGWDIVADDAIDALPDDLPIWLLGWENHFLDALTTDASAFVLDADERGVTLEGSEHRDVSVVITALRDQQPIGLVATAEPAALPGLARKLPHYGKYGYLLFSGSAPDNRLKGQWPVKDSKLMHWFVDARPALQLPARPPLVVE
jgi:aminopeptidase N